MMPDSASVFMFLVMNVSAGVKVLVPSWGQFGVLASTNGNEWGCGLTPISKVVLATGAVEYVSAVTVHVHVIKKVLVTVGLNGKS